MPSTMINIANYCTLCRSALWGVRLFHNHSYRSHHGPIRASQRTQNAHIKATQTRTFHIAHPLGSPSLPPHPAATRHEGGRLRLLPPRLLGGQAEPARPVCTVRDRCLFPELPSSRVVTEMIDPRRCHAATCTICSRTCNGCPPSVPPTPELTMSPATVSPASPAVCSPDALAALSVSFGNLDGSHGLEDERRPALASHTNVTGAMGRRRKQREHDDVDEEGRKGLWGTGDERMKETGILPGCGRIVCRGCAFETPERYVSESLHRHVSAW